MASKNIRGITIEIGGDTTKLGKALEQSEKQTSSLQSELRQVEKLLKFDPDNIELLSQKQKILTQTIEETTDKLKTLEKAEQQVIDQFNRGEIGEDQLRAFQREIIETQTKLSKFESSAKEVEDKLKDLGDSAENSSEGFTIMGGALADLVSSAIQGAVSAIGDFIGSLFELSEATEEYRTMQAKLEGSANTFGYSIDFANEKYKQFYGYLGDDQAATNAITNLMGVGTSTESLSALVDGASAAWATYGDSINVESLTEAINETVTCGKVTGSFADTINWCKTANEELSNALSGNKDAQKAYQDAIKEGLPVEDAFNEALAKITDEQERADVVAKFLNDTYGESKKAYEELNGSIIEANESELALKDTQAQLGEVMQPVNTALQDMKNQALEAITPLVQSLATAFLDLYNYLLNHPTAMKIVTAVVIALATAFGVLAGALAIQGIITGVTKAMAFLNTTLLANPITLVIAAITALVAAFIYLWNNCEDFRKFWIDLWEGIKKAFSAVVDWLKQTAPKIAQFFIDAWNNIKSVWDAVKSYFSNIWSGIVGVFSSVGSWFRTTFTTAKNNILSAWSDIKQKFSNFWTQIKSAFNLKDMLNIGKEIVTGLWNGINDKVGWLKDKISGFVGNVTGWLKKFFKIESPSRLMRDEIGRYIAEGVGVGITENEDKPLNALEELGNNMLDQNLGINGATINRKLNTTFDNGRSDNVLLSKLDNIYERLNRLQIVLDTGALVGETIDKIDSGLASRQMLQARGV